VGGKTLRKALKGVLKSNTSKLLKGRDRKRQGQQVDSVYITKAVTGKNDLQWCNLLEGGGGKRKKAIPAWKGGTD